MPISLYPHQKEALDKLRSGSILCGGVGSGKSRTALAYYFLKECKGTIDDEGQIGKMKAPRDLYIITTARKRDTLEWEQECLPFLLSTHKESCMHSVNVVVDSWNNIRKYDKAYGAFFIFDEQRVVGSGAWVKAFLKISRRNRWILLSATPGDTWMDYIPCFVANGFYKNKTEFVKRHVIFSRFAKYPKVERYIDERRLLKFKQQILVEMPFQRSTVRHRRDILVQYDKTTYDLAAKDRWNIFESEPVRDAGQLCYLLRRIVNSDPDRVNAVRDILRFYPKAIIFYNFDYELGLLREMLESEKIIFSEWNGHRHEPVPESDHWAYLVQYTAGAEGWNCTKTNLIIFYSQNYSYKVMQQAAGRIDRLNTSYKDLYYYHLHSGSSIDIAISKALKAKKRFNERSFSPD